MIASDPMLLSQRIAQIHLFLAGIIAVFGVTLQMDQTMPGVIVRT